MKSSPTRKNPFPGLRPFTQDEDYLFFGREEQTLELMQRLGSNRFVAVVGTSGSGKSSLVRCGLLSELLGGRMLDAGAAWEIAVTHPGGNPLALLTEALLEADLYDREEEDSRENLMATLSRSHFGLVEAVKQADLGAGTNFLLVVDQFEEIFRFHETGQRQQEMANEFVSLLLEAAAQKDVPIYVVLTMRSDFIGECGQFEGLAEMVNRGEFLIPRLTRDQYKRVVEGPIKVAGGQIAPRLLQRLLNDLGQQADQLPCLQHALMRTWEVWAGNGDTEALDLDDYQRVGKMSQALSLHADEIFESLGSDRQRDLCRGMFQALTVEESNSRGIRRPQRLGRLCEILEVPADELLPIIDAYRQSGVTFLMPSPDVELTDQTIIDISHESLMRVWTRLRQWVEEETQAAGIYHRLSESADLHEQGKAGLYRDPELGIALAWREAQRPNAAWADRYRPGFAAATAFLEASQQASVAAEQALEAARQRELEQAQRLAEAQRLRLEQQQRAARRLQAVLAVTVVIALFAVGVSFVAVNFWRAAAAAQKTAQESTEAAEKSAQEAQHSARIAQSEAERATIQQTLASAAREEAEVRAYTASLAAAAADLQRNDSRTLRRRLEEAPERLRGWEWNYLQNESDRSLQTTLTLPSVNEGYHMDIARDGTLVAVRHSGGNSEPVTVYDTRTGEKVAEVKTYSSSSPLMTFSAGNKLLAYHHNGTPGVQIFEIATGRGLVPNPHKLRSFLGFDPAGEQAAVLDERGTVCVFKTTDWSRVTELPGTVDPGDFRRRGAVSPDGKLLVVGAYRADPMRIYDLTTNSLVKEISDSTGALAVEFSGKGDSVTILSPAGDLVQYSTTDWKKVAETHEGRQSRGNFAVHHLDGYLLRMSFDSNGAVALFGFNGLTRSATLRGHGSPGSSIAVDQERDEIVTAHRDGTVCRWDLRHPQDLPIGPLTVAFAPDGATVHAGHQGKPIQVWEVNPISGLPQGILGWMPVTLAHGSSATQLAFSPDGRHLAVATESGWGDSRWRMYDLWSGLAQHEEDSVGIGDLKCIDWSPDGKWIAVGGKSYGGNDGLFRLYDARGYRASAQLEGGAGGVHAVTFSRDSQRLVTAAEDGTLRIWEVPAGRLLLTIGKPGDSAVICAAHSPDGRFLVSGTADGTVAAWNPQNGEQLFRDQVHGAAVQSLAFTPDGSRLMTSSADRSLKVFDPAAWRELLTLHLEEPAQAMSFSPDGRRLALAAGALVFLETQPEAERSGLRRLARGHDEEANAVVERVLKETTDPVEARSQIIEGTAADEALRTAALEKLREWLGNRWFAAYGGENLADSLNLHILRQQLVLRSSQTPSDDQRQQLIAAINSSPTLDAMQRQALADYAAASVSARNHGLVPDESKLDTQKITWEIVSNPKRNPEDHLLACFGMGPVVRRHPQDAVCLMTMAWAEYRVGLYADALDSAEHAAALSQDAAALAPCLAVIAMSQHRMGQTEAGIETLQKLDEAMKRPPESSDQKAVALAAEAREVLASPLEMSWNEQSASDSINTRAETVLGKTKSAIWLASSADRRSRRFLKRGDLEAAAAARQTAQTLLEEQLAASPAGADAAPGIDEVARALADLLLIDATPWTVLKPTQTTSAGGATLSVLDDNSILASGVNPLGDAYTVVAECDATRFSVVRLEALTHESLPNQGPGRDEGRDRGNFDMVDWEIRRQQAGAQSVPILLSRAITDYSAGYISPKFWNVGGGGSRPHTAVYLVENPVTFANGGKMEFRLRFSRNADWPKQNLGRFRLSVSDDPAVFDREQKRFAARKLNDPWAKLAAAYLILNDQPALDALLSAHPAAAVGIGDLYAEDGNWEQAVAAYSKAITAETKDTKPFAKRAEAYENLEQWDPAVADWTRAGRQDPNLAFQRFKRVGAESGNWSFYAQGGAAGSIDVVDGTLELNATAVTGSDWHVEAYQVQLQLENGGEYVIRFKMKSPDACPVRLIASLDQDNWHNIGLSEAIVPSSEFQDYEFTLVPHDAVAGHSRIGFTFGASQGKVFVKDLVILKKSEGVDFYTRQGLEYARRGQRDEALAAFTRVLQLTTERAARAKVIAAASLLEGALETLAESVPNDGQFQSELARYYAEQGNTELADTARSKARALYEQQLAKEPENAALAAELADMLLQPVGARNILPTSESEGIAWLFTTTQPPEDWMNEGFDASAWKQELGGFGAADSPGFVRRTDWTTSDIWLRQTFEWQPAATKHALVLRLIHDDDAEVYFNGRQVARLPGWTPAYIIHPLDSTAEGTLHAGVNTIAVHCRQYSGGQTIDVGLAEMPYEPIALRQRIAALTLADPWAKLAAAYLIINNQPALDALLTAHPAAAAGIGDLYAEEKKWERAIAAYGKLITPETTDAALLARRARAYMASEQWELAKADWLRVIEQQPDQLQTACDEFKKVARWKEAAEFGLKLVQQKPEDSLLWLRIAPILVLAEDRAAYADFCGRMVEQFADSQLAEDAERVVKAALLRSGLINLNKLPAGKFTSMLDNGTGPDWFPSWGWGTRALFAWRSGDADSVLKYAAKSEESKPSEVSHAFNLALVAAAQHHLQHPDEARKALEEALLVIKRLKEDSGMRIDHDLLIAEILFREAEALIKGKARP